MKRNTTEKEVVFGNSIPWLIELQKRFDENFCE